jgi:hypothetical protein
MAINLDAIRKKLGELSGKNNKRDRQWKPEEGKEYTIRLISFQNNDGLPFKDRYYYYNIGKNPGILAPYQFGKSDPIKELRSKLYDEGSEASKELAKKLAPKMRTFAPVIVRGEEDKGVRIWAFGKIVYQDLLNLITNEDYGDITDLVEGRDIKVQLVKAQGKQFADTKFTPRVKTEPLSKDPNLVKQWVGSIPEVDGEADLKSYTEIEKIVNDWINSGMGDSDSSPTETTRGGPAQKTVEDTSNQQKLAAFSDDDDGFTTKAAPKAQSKTKTKTAQQELDDAFADLSD